MKPGFLMVVSGPAGVGKGTLVSELIRLNEQTLLSVSATTRAPRPGEEDGVQYWFKDRQSFEQMIHEDQLLEWVEYCGNYYGTPVDHVTASVAEGKIVILEIEVEGALNIRRIFPDAVLVFILPPDLETLKKRLSGRGTEPEDVIYRRLKRAEEELSFLSRYDYFVMNVSIPQAVEKLTKIIDAEQRRVNRNPELVQRFQVV